MRIGHGQWLAGWTAGWVWDLWDLSVPTRDFEPGPSTVKVQSPNHWTAREFPGSDVGCSAGLRPCLVSLEVLEEMLS